MEECAEVQQAVSKALRFGLNDSYKDYGNNKERIESEICDLMGVLELLYEEKIIPMPDNWQDRVAAKKTKVMRYMDYARERGALDESA
jgi:NTP pyrophosphatase (non-canonical NTP hydrolase)